MGALGFPETFVSLLFYCSLLTSEFTLCEGSSDIKDFITATTSECHYLNRTQDVRFLERFIYNQEEFLYFDSKEGKYIPKTEFGKPDADYWNSNKEIIDYKKSAVQRLCIHNYGVFETAGAIGRKVKPSIKISLMNQDEPSQGKQHLLICNVFAFYPSEIEVKWYRNGQEETEQVQSTEPYLNGDWTFQILVMLETEIQKGDKFTCEVHHKSLEAPYQVDWHPQSSDAAKNKMATGIVGLVLGIVFLIVGLVIYMRGRKAQTPFHGHQNERFLSQ